MVSEIHGQIFSNDSTILNHSALLNDVLEPDAHRLLLAHSITAPHKPAKMPISRSIAENLS